MIGKIPVPKGVLVIKDVSQSEFSRLLDDWKDVLDKTANDGIDGIMVIGGREVEYISFEDKALELWKELIFYLRDDPFVNDTTDYGRDPSCFFCGSDKPHHESSCIYIRARNLIETGYWPDHNTDDEELCHA